MERVSAGGFIEERGPPFPASYTKRLFASTIYVFCRRGLSKILSTRVGRETEEELRSYMRAEKVDKATAMRKLLELGVQGWRREMAVQLLREGKATVWRAATVAGVPLWDFISLLDERKVILPIRGSDVIDDVRAAMKGKS